MRMRMLGLAAALLLAVQTVGAEDKKITIWWAQWDPAAASTRAGPRVRPSTRQAKRHRPIGVPRDRDCRRGVPDSLARLSGPSLSQFRQQADFDIDFDIVVGDSQ